MPTKSKNVKSKLLKKTQVPKTVKRSEATENEVYIPGKSRDLKRGEELVCDTTAYTMLHRFDTEHPCLSFDIIPDSLGQRRDAYPMSCYLASGTQAEKVRDNRIVVMLLKNLTRQKKKEKSDDEEDSSSSESEDEENEPVMSAATIKHHGGINRLRVTRLCDNAVCAVWNDLGKVQIWSLSSCLNHVAQEADSDSAKSSNEIEEKPLFTFDGHLSEGYAIDWSSIVPGKMLSGDNRRNIHLWTVMESGQWNVDQRPFSSHASSIEDIQWSPTEDNVFASCSSDKSIRLWDCRVAPQQACVCVVSDAHDKDVNVLSWNHNEPLLVSGGDDCALKIWDLKFIQNSSPVALFKHHTKPITSVHWYKHDSTVFAAAGADNQVTIWDLAVEPDDEMEVQNSSQNCDVAPQLMFLHSGQDEIKEVRWHPQLCGTAITTALDGFDIFRPVNL